MEDRFNNDYKTNRNEVVRFKYYCFCLFWGISSNSRIFQFVDVTTPLKDHIWQFRW